MAETFRLKVERWKEELLKQVQPGTGIVKLYMGANHNEEEEMAAGEAAVDIAGMLQRPVNLHFTDGKHQTEAGRKGGRTVRDTYGEDYYRRIGKKGGTTLKERRGSEYYRQIAKKGGQANVRKYGPAHFSEMGKKGGNTTKERQDPDFYRRIGKIGGSAKRQKKEDSASNSVIT